MCDLDRRTFLKAVPAASLLAGEFVYGWRAHAQVQPIKIGAPLPLTGPAAPLGQHSLWGRRPRSASSRAAAPSGAGPSSSSSRTTAAGPPTRSRSCGR
jgi:hypothetical protein